MNCKFNKDELIALSAAIKIAANSDMELFMNTYNAFIKHHYPEDQANHMVIEDEETMFHYICELRGNVKSLIRNS